MIYIEKNTGCKYFDLSIGNQGEVRRWNFGQLEKWFALSFCSKDEIIYKKIGMTVYRYFASDEKAPALKEYISECQKAERQKAYEEYLKTL